FRVWTRIVLALAPVPLVSQAVTFWLAGHTPHYPRAALGVALVCIALVFASILGTHRPTLQAVPSQMRRRVRASWLGLLVGTYAVPLVVWLMTPSDRPEVLLLTFPVWLLIQGVYDCGMASLAGILYVIGTADFVVAIVMALLPAYSPLIGSVLISLSLLLQGLAMRRLGREPR